MSHLSTIPAVKAFGTPVGVLHVAGLSRGLSASSLEGWYCFYVAARLLSEDDQSVVDRAQHVRVGR